MDERARFCHAIAVVLTHEGGYVYDPNDPGGETKYGISKRSYPRLDIKNLSRDEAVNIYRKDWWERHRYGEIQNVYVATKVFDLAINLGAVGAHTLLQRALHACGRRDVAIDGILGPQTLGAANQVDPGQCLVALRALAAERYRRLIEANPALARYENGWLKRAYA